uniref:Uncharacterized protein n=1 Tax=Sym plasmid TaxID=28430 RepID=A0A515HIH5_9ZZZZ|nr:hypothetical protein pTL25_00049 [Sym plasmid]
MIGTVTHASAACARGTPRVEATAATALTTRRSASPNLFCGCWPYLSVSGRNN